MKAYRTVFEIPAQPSAIWAALVDFPRWAQWNPIIPGIRGRAEPGARITLALVSPLLPFRFSLPVRTRICTCEPDRELRWTGGVPGVFVAEHGWRLEPTGPTTRVVHEEAFGGALVLLLGRRMDRRLPASYEQMNAGLHAIVSAAVRKTV